MEASCTQRGRRDNRCSVRRTRLFELLLDDTWTKGGHAQSAALALGKAGASKVSALVAARWINRDFRNNAAFLDGLPDYDLDICPWTGGACPRRT